MRVNARLDDSYEDKFAYLQEATHLCVSDIVRESVDRYYEAVKAEQASKRHSLDALVGAFEGRPDTPDDLSTNYKKYVAEAIDAKYPRHGDR
ncbi:MAG: CopG family transcriptional regulator [Rhodocyclaceae bacterium]|nr:CopG family transcriptional regulator [Rhodocyclaceae bacterium]